MGSGGSGPAQCYANGRAVGGYLKKGLWDSILAHPALRLALRLATLRPALRPGILPALTTKQILFLGSRSVLLFILLFAINSRSVRVSRLRRCVQSAQQLIVLNHAVEETLAKEINAPPLTSPGAKMHSR